MVEDLTDEEIISLEASEVRLNQEQRKLLLNDLVLWYQNPLSEEIGLANEQNLAEFLDILCDLSRSEYKYVNDEILDDFKVIHSLLSKLKNKTLKAFVSLIEDVMAKLEECLKTYYQYPYGTIEEREYYRYYPYGYQYSYYEKPSKYEHYQKALDKAIALAKEYDLKSKNLDNPTIWDFISIDLATSNIGNRKLSDLLKDKLTADEIIKEACNRIKEEILTKKDEEYQRLSNKIQELEKEYEQKEKELENFRWKVIEKWIQTEKERMEQ
jgi:hypothetical protein